VETVAAAVAVAVAAAAVAVALAVAVAVAAAVAVAVAVAVGIAEQLDWWYRLLHLVVVCVGREAEALHLFLSLLNH